MERFDFGRPMIGEEERAAVLEVLSGPILVHGPRAKQFEQEFADYVGAQEAVSVSSCTAGMHLVYFALGYGPGDEVIVPAQTHVATAHAVALTGATPVFVDSEPVTGNIDVARIENSITERTRAICVVHYLGVPVNMEEVLNVADKYGLFVMEDCALALGASRNQIHVGNFGGAGVFSFYPVKHMTTAEGGIVLLKDGELAQAVRLARAFGVDRTHGDRSIPGMYDALKLGFNYRMSEIHAAIGIAQLKKLPGFLAQRKKNHEVLAGVLGVSKHFTVLPQPVTDNISSSHYCLGLLLGEKFAPRRAELMNRLQELGVGASVYYPHPVPRMTAYQSQDMPQNFYEEAAKISDSIIALPVGPHLGEIESEKVGQACLAAISEML